MDSMPAQATPSAGHGTACAGIIRQIAPTAILYDVRIFDESLTADPPSLLAAIRWTIEHQMDVVNLSLGTADITFRDRLADLCRQARDAGVIIVAAELNDERESYPAVLPDVIGVAGGKVRGRYGYYYLPGEAIECVARGDAQRVCWTDPPYRMMAGTSFAAPRITGVVALIRQAHPGAPLEKVREMLQTHALKGTPEQIEDTRPRAVAVAVPSDLPSDRIWLGFRRRRSIRSIRRCTRLSGREIYSLSRLRASPIRPEGIERLAEDTGTWTEYEKPFLKARLG